MNLIKFDKDTLILDGVRFKKRKFLSPLDTEYFNYKGNLYVKIRTKSERPDSSQSAD